MQMDMTRRNNAPSEWMDKTCPNCGREFQTLYSYQKYCTEACCIEVQNERQRGKYKRDKLAHERKSLKWFVN
jgi:hypothetical protein